MQNKQTLCMAVKNEMKYIELQKKLYIIPFISTIVILLITLVELIRNKASRGIWFRFNLALFFSIAALGILTGLLASYLRVVAYILALLVLNKYLINLQLLTTSPKKERSVPVFSSRITIFLIGLIGAVISIVAVYIFLSNDSSSIRDMNGAEDTSLVSISVDEMLLTKGNYSATLVQASNSGQKTQVAKELEEYDSDNITFRCKKIDGVRTLQATKVPYDTVVISIESAIKSGNMEMIVLIDDTYYCHVPTNCMHKLEIKDAIGKTIIVRMAAESAEVEVTISRSY